MAITIDKSQGYVILWRSIMETAIHTNSKLERVYLWVMMKANWEQKEVFETRNKTKLNPGQFITSLPHAAKELGMGQATVDAYLNILKSERIIDRTPTPKYTIVTVLNWEWLQNPDRIIDSRRRADGELTDTDNTYNTYNDVSKGEQNKQKLTLVQEIWNTYLQCSQSSEQLLPARKVKIAQRLKTFKPDQIKQAIKNCFADKFYSGKNDRGWKANADYFFRSDEIIDTLLNLHPTNEKLNWRNAPYD